MSSTTAQTGTTTYAIDASHSQVGFSVKHMMFSTVRGNFRGFQGTIVVDHANPANSSVNVTIDASTITTGDEKRDEHLRSADFFDAANYPTITFKSTSIDFKDAEKFTINGELTMHGVTNAVKIEAEQTGEGTNPWGIDVAGFEGSAKINRKDFGLNWNASLEKGGVLVGEEIKINLELEAAKQ
ncbi:MAG: YceI family protein [Thermomicrobiales bacterium]|nr:YceI family protein [Thermomicrobiales bacterium]